MTHRSTITLDNEAYNFLMEKGGKNKSAYINRILHEKRQLTLQKDILTANQEEANDLDYQNELEEWDSTLSDGLNS